MVYGPKDGLASGKYMHDGVSDRVNKYTNPDNVSITRARLHETPELGITNQALKEAPGFRRSYTDVKQIFGADANNDSEEEKVISPASPTNRNPLDVFDLAGDQLDPMVYQPLRGVGLRMIVMALRDQVTRRLRHKAEIERKMEAEFQAEMERAADDLSAVNKSSRAGRWS